MNKFLTIFACVLAVCNAGYVSPASYSAGYGVPIDAQALNLAAIALGLPAPAGGPLVQPIANLYGAVPVVARAPLLASAPVLAAPAYAAAPVLRRPAYANPALLAAAPYRGVY